MSDVVYRIVADLGTTGGLTSGALSSKLADLDSGVTKIGSGMRGLASSMSSMFTDTVEKVASIGLHMAKWGIVGGVGLAITGVSKFNDELERTQISLASIFN